MVEEPEEANDQDTSTVSDPPRWRRLTHRAAILAALIAVVAIFVAANALAIGDEPVFTSPKFNSVYQTARPLTSGNRPAVDLPLFDQLPQSTAIALTPRDAALLDGSVVPKDFPGAVVTVAVAQTVIAPIGINLLAAVLAAVAALLVGLLATEISRRPSAGWVASTLFITGTSVIAATLHVAQSELGGVALLVGGAYSMLRSERSTSSSAALWWATAGGMAFGAAITFRYTLAVLVVGFGIVALFRLRDRWTLILAASLGGLATLAFIPVFNWWAYGSPTASGYSVGQSLFSSTVNPVRSWPFGMDMAILLSHIRIYLLRPEVLTLLAMATLGTAFAARTRRSPAWWVVIPVVGGGLGLIVYHAGRNTYGAFDFVANASFMRYLIALFALVAVLAAFAWAQAPQPFRTILIGVIILVMGASIHAAIFELGGVQRYRSTQERTALQRSYVLDLTPSDAVVISRSADKFLWPDRTTLTASYLVSNESQIDLGTDRLFQQIPTPQRLAEVISQVCAIGHPPFLMNQDEWLSAEDRATLEEILESQGMSMFANEEYTRLISIGCGDQPLPDVNS